MKDLKIPFEENYSKHVYYMYEIKTSKRDELMSFLKENNIAAGIHYPMPLHLQPSLRYLGYKEGDFPVAEKAAKEILSLPMFPELTEEQIKYTAEKIKEFNLISDS